MKLLFVAALSVAAPLAAQTAAPASAPAPTSVPTVATATTAAFTLDTPIETLAANEKAKAVIAANLPDLLAHPSYDSFKGMSLNQLAPYSQGKLTSEVLAKVSADLAALK